MEFLKGIISSSRFPNYSIDAASSQLYQQGNSLFTLSSGTARATNTPCSILSFNANGKSQSAIGQAKNYLKTIKTLRHPGIAKFLDSHETATEIFIAIEASTPLKQVISRLRESKQGLATIALGINTLCRTISFIHTEAHSIHANISLDAILVTENNEFRLAGFEVFTCMADERPFILDTQLPYQMTRTLPPELNGDMGKLEERQAVSIDSWQFALFLQSVYNGSEEMKDQGKIPKSMYTTYKRLQTPSPTSRIPISTFLAQGERKGSFFDIPIVMLSKKLSSMPMMPKDELQEFVRTNLGSDVKDVLPDSFIRGQVVPVLLKVFEFSEPSSLVLGTLLALATPAVHGGGDEKEEVFAKTLLPMFLRTWPDAKDPQVRLTLLDPTLLPIYLPLVPPKTINDVIFPALQKSFNNTAPILRESAVRSLLTFSPYLTDSTLNGKLLRYLAQTAQDSEPGIRTNTTICLGKIAHRLGLQTRRKVLVAAFSRSLKDPFVHARVAALQAISATATQPASESAGANNNMSEKSIYEKDDIAIRILPSLTPCLIDSEKIVREAAQKTLDVLLSVLSKLIKDMPDSLLPPSSDSSSNNGKKSDGNVITDAATTWGNWAASSLSKSLATTTLSITREDLQGNKTDGLHKSASTSTSRAPNSALHQLDQNSQKTAVSQLAVHGQRRSASAPISSSKGLKLQAVKKPNYVVQVLADEDYSGDWGDGSIFDDPPDVQNIEDVQAQKITALYPPIIKNQTKPSIATVTRTSDSRIETTITGKPKDMKGTHSTEDDEDGSAWADDWDV